MWNNKWKTAPHFCPKHVLEIELYISLLHMGCAVTHCTSSWVLPQLPILFLQLIPYRALHPETREALTKWGIIRRPLMQVRNTFRSLRAVSFKVVFVWVFFFLFFSRKSNMRGDEQTDAEEMFAGIRRAALDSPDGDQAAGRVMEGREQVYISAWPAVTCADECAQQLMNPAA